MYYIIVQNGTDVLGWTKDQTVCDQYMDSMDEQEKRDNKVMVIKRDTDRGFKVFVNACLRLHLPRDEEPFTWNTHLDYEIIPIGESKLILAPKGRNEKYVLCGHQKKVVGITATEQ